jgi:hypothetical protein
MVVEIEKDGTKRGDPDAPGEQNVLGTRIAEHEIAPTSTTAPAGGCRRARLKLLLRPLAKRVVSMTCPTNGADAIVKCRVVARSSGLG